MEGKELNIPVELTEAQIRRIFLAAQSDERMHGWEKPEEGDHFFYEDGLNRVQSGIVNNNSKAMTIAGRGLLGVAVGMTVIGNLFTLIDFNKDKGSKVQASTSLIDDSKEKVVC